MAQKCKVSYFDVMSIGEPIRYLLSYGGIEFEDFRFKLEEWPKLKPNYPFGKVPVLEIDGKVAYQSIPICRYLANKVGLAGTDEWQKLKIDSTVDTVGDLRLAMYNAHYGGDDAKKEAVKKETIPYYLERLDTQVKENGGYLVDKKLTWADLHFASFVDGMNDVYKTDLTAPYPNLKALVTKVWDLPKIKAWRAKRPHNNV